MDTARDHIARIWPEHLPHLAPEGNKMGQGEITEEGVVCNCGVILGFPKVQDETEYLEEDTRGVETTAVEAGWNDLQDEPEHQYNPAADETAQGGPVMPGKDAMATGERTIVRAEDSMQQDYEQDMATKAREYGNPETHPDGSWRCRFDGQLANQHPVDWPGQFHCITPQPYPHPGEPDPVSSTPGPPPAVRGEMPARDLGVVQAEDPIAARVVIIDPTLPYGPQDVEHQLLDINGRIERGVHFQRYWEERHFVAKSEYEIGYARAMVKAQGGSADVRKANALLACEDQWRELQLCEAMVRAVRETMHNLRSLQSGYQTVSRSVGESMRMPNTRP